MRSAMVTDLLRIVVRSAPLPQTNQPPLQTVQSTSSATSNTLALLRYLILHPALAPVHSLLCFGTWIHAWASVPPHPRHYTNTTHQHHFPNHHEPTIAQVGSGTVRYSPADRALCSRCAF